MSQPQEHNHSLSMMLSEVLQDIGVTETMVGNRRRTWMIHEALKNTTAMLLNSKETFHFFGSQSEASTTLGLNSNIDMLSYRNDVQVIQDLSQWQPNTNKHQYLMVQDETVSPGYCLLQLLRRDAPLPVHDFDNEYHSTDSKNRLLLRHSFCLRRLGWTTLHGPAQLASPPDGNDIDYVESLYCSSWPQEAIPWLQQQNSSGWPTEHMKRYAADQGCFVVPVGSKQGLYQDLEWRISTSMAERCLVYNLNITQIWCYILMKMIIKTFLRPTCGEAVSSFMCKNILFYSIADSEVNSTWNEGCLVTRLNQCLQALLHCILTENCPHFVIPRNNLLAGKLSVEVKRQLADVVRTIIGNIEQSLFGIQIDHLGDYVRMKLDAIQLSRSNPFLVARLRLDLHSTSSVSADLIWNLSGEVLDCIKSVQKNVLINGDTNAQYLTNIISKVDQLYRDGSEYVKVAVSLLRPFLCTMIGSIKASADIEHSQNISPEALEWFSRGLNSDVSSSMLKKASALYCAGELENCEIIMAAVPRNITHTTVRSICVCYPDRDLVKVKADFGKLCFKKNENMIKHNIAFCVTYMQSEINCIPGDLKYEMFRSTEEDRPYRSPEKDYWMDWAVVDSKSYLYFLQYKVYSQLHRPADQHRALDNLARTIETDPDLGHRETALNLLGQCMEQKNWQQLALYCYKLSLSIKNRKRNNAAQWHVCRLLARLVRSQS